MNVVVDVNAVVDVPRHGVRTTFATKRVDHVHVHVHVHENRGLLTRGWDL